MRPALYPVAVLLAVIIAFAALNPIHHTRAECSGTTCDVVLDGFESKINVLGQDIVFYRSDGVLASFGIAGKPYSCIKGETVDTPKLMITCEAVGADILRAEVSEAPL